MKRIKMKRNREVGDVTYHGDSEVVAADGVADLLIAEGHAVLVEALPDQVKPEVAPKRAPNLGSRKSDDDGFSEQRGHAKRKKK